MLSQSWAHASQISAQTAQVRVVKASAWLAQARAAEQVHAEQARALPVLVAVSAWLVQPHPVALSTSSLNRRLALRSWTARQR